MKLLLALALIVAPVYAHADVAGPLDDIDRGATATAIADRLTPPTTTTPPFDPSTLSDCDEMTWYRIAAGLPARFDQIGYRESRCTNTPISRTGCCVGYWQLHEIIFRDHRMIDGLAGCEATWWNVRGDSAEAKRRQACAARVLFDVNGYQPWAL